MKHRLYLPAAYQEGQQLTLPDEAAHYLLRVLRLSTGEPIELFDGTGQAALATVVSAAKKGAQVRIDALLPPLENESPLQTILVQGISRGERMDYTVQKATELGVCAIQPVFTQYCEVRLKGDKLEKKRRHWQQVAIAACEQCGRRIVPPVYAPIPLKTWLAQPRTGFVLDPEAVQSLSQMPEPPQPLHILVGPEGGLSREETAAATRAGLIAVHLGPRILRTETAGCALLAAAQVRWGDW